MTNEDRFINEFNDDLVKHLGVHGQFVVSQHLGVDDLTDYVHLYVIIRDANNDEHELMNPSVLYDPAEPDEDLWERVCCFLNVPDRDLEVHARLVKAELVSCDFNL